MWTVTRNGSGGRVHEVSGGEDVGSARRQSQTPLRNILSIHSFTFSLACVEYPTKQPTDKFQVVFSTGDMEGRVSSAVENAQQFIVPAGKVEAQQRHVEAGEVEDVLGGLGMAGEQRVDSKLIHQSVHYQTVVGFRSPTVTTNTHTVTIITIINTCSIIPSVLHLFV